MVDVSFAKDELTGYQKVTCLIEAMAETNLNEKRTLTQNAPFSR